MATHRTLRAFVIGLFAMVIGGLVPESAVAGMIAEFTFKDKQTIPFKNDGDQSTLEGDSIKVTFKFDLPNTYGAVNANIDAQLELVAKVSGKATNNNENVNQPMTLASLIVIADNKVGGKNQLFTSLALNRVSADLDGKLNAKTTIFSGPGNNSPRPLPAVSDFFDFSNYTDIGFQVQLTKMDKPLTINKNGYLDSFSASGSGMIFGQPIVANVPEPSTILLMTSGAGLLTVAFLIRRPAVDR